MPGSSLPHDSPSPFPRVALSVSLWVAGHIAHRLVCCLSTACNQLLVEQPAAVVAGTTTGPYPPVVGLFGHRVETLDLTGVHVGPRPTVRLQRRRIIALAVGNRSRTGR
ncbi:MAG: hypothetical protein CM1200mP2_24460 [Planctomycetaceae bacterium]|nr:MAG: hypothetical protein CM1200mP2_24460 [Planctomycetaceae bacterium]